MLKTSQSIFTLAASVYVRASFHACVPANARVTVILHQTVASADEKRWSICDTCKQYSCTMAPCRPAVSAETLRWLIRLAGYTCRKSTGAQ